MSGTTGDSHEVAGLSFAIDSQPVVAATQSLDNLRQSSDQLARSHDGLTQSTQRFIAIAREVGDSTALMRRQFNDTSSSLDGLIANLDKARASLDGTRASFAQLADAKGAVDALGQSFGITSAGIEEFTAQSDLLGLSASQTTLAMQRITEALNNQTLAGQQVRREIQGLGVDLSGLTSNNAGDVLAQVVARLRTAQDGIGRFQTEATVLGITDPTALYNINTPSYIPTEQRRQLGYAQQADKQIAQTTQVVSNDERQIGLDDSQYADLNGQYNLGGYSNFSPFSGLSSTQRAQLATRLNLPSDTNFRSQGDRLSALRYLSANPNSDLSNSARTLSARATNAFDTSGVGGAYRHLFDGTFSSNESDIQDRYDQSVRSSDTVVGRAGAFGSAQLNELLNLVNGYTPQLPSPDARAPDPDTVIRNSQQAAGLLAGFGDDSGSRYQGFAGDLRNLNANGLSTFTGAYGAAEGTQRFGQTAAGLTYQRDQALTPNGDAIDAAKRQAYLLSIPLEQRGQAQALLDYYDKNVPGGASQLYAYGGATVSPTDALNLSGTSGGPGFLSPAQSRGFTTAYGLQQGNAATGATQSYDQQLTQQQALTDAAVQGSAAIDDLRSRQQAYNAALKDGKDAADLAAQREQNLTDARRTTVNQAALRDKLFANDQQDTLNAALGSVLNSGGSAVDYSVAQTNQGLLNQYQQALRDKSAQGVSFGQFSDPRLGVMTGVDLQRALEELRKAKVGQGDANSQLGAALTGGGDGSIERGQQLYDQFAESFGHATARGQEFVTALNQVVDGIDQARTATAALALEAKNYSAARSNYSSASDARYISTLPLGQQDLARQQIGVVRQGGYNPVLDQHADLSQGLQQTIDAQAKDLGITDPGLLQVARTIPRLEGATDNPAGFASDPATYLGLTGDARAAMSSNTPQAAVRAMLQYLQQNAQKFPGDPIAAGFGYGPAGPNSALTSRFAASGDTDLTGATPDEQKYAVALGGGDPATILRLTQADPTAQGASVRAQLGSLPGLRTAQTGLQVQQLQGGAQGRNSLEQQILSLLGQGRTGDVSLLEAGVNQDPSNPQLGNAQAAQRVIETQRSLQEEATRSTASTQQQITANNDLAAAYSKGADAVTRANAAIQAHNEALANPKVNEATRSEQLYAEAVSKANEAAAQSIHAQQLQGNVDQFSAGLPIESEALRQRQVDQFSNFQQIDTSSASPQQKDQQKQAYLLTQQNKDLATSAQQVNSTFNEMGKTIYDGFQNAINSGESFKRTLGGIATSLADLIEQLVIEKPLENFFANSVGGLFGNSLNGVATTAGSAAIGSGGFWNSVASGVNSVSSAVGIGALFARGGAFDQYGQVRMHASGSVVNGPTGFSGTDGSSNVMGEAGPEGILPLKVMPDGNLGVQSANTAQSIVFHTPVTIQGNMSGGANGGIDPATLKVFQRQIEASVAMAFKSQTLNAQRPGGMLYGTQSTS